MKIDDRKGTDKSLSLKHVKANYKTSHQDHDRFHSAEPVMGNAI